MSAFHVPEDSRFTRWQMRSTEPLTRTARPPRRSIDEDRVKELICGVMPELSGDTRLSGQVREQ